MKKSALSLALAAVLLSGCGGSDDAPGLQAGEEFTSEISLGDTVVETSTYRVYAVTAQGELSTDASAQVGNTLLPLLIKRERNSALKSSDSANNAMPPLAEQQEFFKAMWASLSRHYNTTDAQTLLQKLGDYDSSLWLMHSHYTQSGLTLEEFIAFHETIDDFPHVNTDLAESDLYNLLQLMGLNQRQLQDTLLSLQSSWRALLGTMNTRQHNFDELRTRYAQSGLSAQDFLGQYLQNDSAKMLKGDDDKGPAAILKLAWDIIKDNKPKTEADGAFTRVFSSKDANWENYTQAKEGRSDPPVKVKGKNAFGMTLYKAEFRLTGYYDARHPTIGGSWMPLVRLDVRDMYAMMTWTLNAKASVTLPVNVGTVEAPIPVMPVYMEIHEKGLLQNYLEKFEFTAHGKNGFSSKN